MSTELANKTCRPCQGDAEPLSGEALEQLQRQLAEGWDVVDEHHLHKTYEFENFRDALDFTNRVGEVAEDQGHHPNICLTWGKVEIRVWTHKIDGLTESDFIFAAKADEAL